MGPSLFIFGLGYVGKAAALYWQQKGYTVVTRVRCPATALWAQKRGITLCDEGQIPNFLSQSQAMLVTIPPGPGDVWARGFAVSINPAAWVGYLSATSVYGDTQGEWVTEENPCNPHTSQGEERLKAEEAWHKALPQTHIFRLTGIYGLGRSVVEQLLTGTARKIIKPGHTLGRIHMDDIIHVLDASYTHPNPGRTYNVTDDLPAPTADVIDYAASLMGITSPTGVVYEDAVAQGLLSLMMMGFYNAHRRVDNTRIKQELGVTLKYPTYKEGIKAILKSDLA